jgi:hypothetical protein
MQREAKRRRFFEADAKAFPGDVLPWNWSIWEKQFSDFMPILDFIHVLSYFFPAAKAAHERSQDAWSQEPGWMRGAWQGEVEQVLEELRMGQEKLGAAASDPPDSDSRKVLATTIT